MNVEKSIKLGEGGVMYLNSVNNYVKKFNELHPENKCKIVSSYLRSERIVRGECLYLYLVDSNEEIWHIAINNINDDGSIKDAQFRHRQKFKPYLKE
tara:strand:- start:23 stop:313 length:291 start_codon:yes stop_codon:yes gene_type:complete